MGATFWRGQGEKGGRPRGLRGCESLVDGWPEGERKSPLVWGFRAGTKALLIMGPGDEIAPVGSPEGEAPMVGSSG